MTGAVVVVVAMVLVVGNSEVVTSAEVFPAVLFETEKLTGSGIDVIKLTATTSRGVPRLNGALGKKPVWCPHVHT